MELRNFLEIVDLISDTIKPIKGETGYDTCNDCDADIIKTAIVILKTIDKKYTISKRDNNAQRRQIKT